MPEVARDSTALELLRVQRSRLADRMRPPWWYFFGVATLWALSFACPFTSRYFPQGLRIWPVLVAGLAVAGVLQWGLARATGIKVGFRSPRSPASGRRARLAMPVVAIAALVTEAFLIRRGLIGAAIAVAAIAVGAEVVGQQALLRAIRQDLRSGGQAP